MGQGATAALSWPRSCLPLAGPHEEMWQQGPAFHGLPRRWARGQVSGLALGSPEQPVQVRQAVLPLALKPGSKATTWA